jgi:hypothetical protein
MPASMVMVTTDDPESLKREREALAAKTRQDPNYIPMIAVSSRTNRGRVDMVRLFHTLQEMDYLPVRAEIRERVSAIWGVSPMWQGAPDNFGGLSQQTAQLTVMGRVVERDQRQITEKIFPSILSNFGITDWKLVLPNPEEKAEATRIAQSQQRAAIAQQMLTMGFDVQLKGNKIGIDDLDFIVTGEAVPTAKLQGEQQALALEQAEQQAAMQEAMMEQQQAGGGEEAPPEEGVEEAPPEEGSQEVPVENAVTDIPERIANIESKNIKNPNLRKGVSTSTWIDSLSDQGYSFPIIKQISPDGQHIWFSNNGQEYIGNLSGTGVDKIEKAYFGNPVFSDVGGKKPLSDAYTAETGDGTSKPKAVDVSDDEDD